MSAENAQLEQTQTPPPNGKSRGNAGRKTRLTPEVQDVIIAAIKAGNYISDAAEFAGVSTSTVNEWIRRGEARDASRPVKSKYAAFAAAVKRAEGYFTIAALKRIQDAGRGGAVRERETTIRTLKDGGTETKTVEKYSAGFWQADAWILERRFPDKFGRRDRLDHASPGSNKVEHEHAHNIDITALIDKIYADPESVPGEISTDLSDDLTNQERLAG